MSASEGRCVHEMLPGQCGNLRCPNAPETAPPSLPAHPEGPANPFAIGLPPEPPPYSKNLPNGQPPWFAAAYDGECSGCGGHIHPGDMIRADEAGGWEGECCGP